MPDKSTTTFWDFLLSFTRNKKIFLSVFIPILVVVITLVLTGYLGVKRGEVFVGKQNDQNDTIVSKHPPSQSQTTSGDQSPNINAGKDVILNYGDPKSKDTSKTNKGQVR